MDTKNTSIETAADKDLRDRMYNFLHKQLIGVLSTVTPKHEPHAAVIYFSVDPSLIIRFTTKKGTRKHANLQHDGHVMFVCYEGSSQTEIQVTGKAVKITEKEEEDAAFDGMLQASMKVSKEGVPPLTKLEAGNFESYRIEPTQINMEVYGRPDHGGYEMFETLKF
jgi:nitroimidazol reductase NimA-like FMN-containing flavoprotein (pyridoxamine 5'-phosphate oxidase superfamily)